MRLAPVIVLAGLIASAALAQQDQPVAPAPDDLSQPPPPPAAAPSLPPPPPEIGPAVQGPPKITKPKPKAAPTPTPALPPPPKPTVLRSPVAVLQVLDKVTAETLRFEAPVGRPVRYKNLVVQVRACETRGYDDPSPRASAYLMVDTAAAGPSGRAEVNQVFRGWMFAYTPSLHALHHPTYDLWLIACSAAAPST